MTDETRDVWRQRLTIPNALSVFRIVAAPVLVGLAVSGERNAVVLLFVAMAMSDWIDGKLAVLLDQRSDIGPRIDSAADLMMYGGLLLAAIILDGTRLLSEGAWIALPVLAYLVAGAFSLAKFGRWPHHHTRMAKISWGLMLLGAVVFLGEVSRWPLRVALISAACASGQSVLITRVLPTFLTDIPSVAAARRVRLARRGRKP